MPNNSQLYPPFAGANFKVKNITADDSDSTLNTIPAGVVSVNVVGVTNDTDDYIVLPLLETVQEGHEISIQCTTGGAFEMRTPASSTELINDKDCDGTLEYLCTDTEVLKVIKIDNTIGWMAHAYSAVGEVVTAVVPD